MTRADDCRVVVTGATGFVGRHVMQAFTPRWARPLSVRAGDDMPARLAACCGRDQPFAMVHAGGRAHRRAGSRRQEEDRHQRDNRELTVELARAAAAHGIRRFVFVSTLHVLGTSSQPGRPLTAGDRPAPPSAYARAKYAAELDLQKVSRETGLEVAIVRPALAYGSGAGGNIARLAAAIRSGVPLPLGALYNRRSLVNVRDLADLLVSLCQIEEVPPAPLLAADMESVSTTELVTALAQALGRPARLVKVPAPLLCHALRLVGKSALAQQLAGTLEADISETRARTGWRPHRGLRQGTNEFAT